MQATFGTFATIPTNMEVAKETGISKAVVGELGGLSPLGGGSWIGARQPDPGTLRGAFARRIVSGDSGNPVFLLVGKEPVLVYCLHTGGGGGGPAVHALRIAIQAAMDALAPGYRLETV